MPKKNKTSPRRNALRIIGGQWRSRKIEFIDVPGLRPTPDRLRETLFNWLQSDIAGARCLDAFAGTGALGLEALSRGATYVTFIEQHQAAAQQLEQNLQRLTNQNNASVINTDGIHYLENLREPVDIIFLDPPFRKDLLENCLNLIQEKSLLTSKGLVYIEQEKALDLDINALGYSILKEKKAGQVYCALLNIT